MDIRSQLIFEDSTAPTNDKICDQIFGTRFCYVRRLGYEIRAPPSSCSSRADIHAACDARLVKVQRQATEDRQRAEQQADELATRIDEYQLLQTQMME